MDILITITINTDNASFRPNPLPEVIRLINKAADKAVANLNPFEPDDDRKVKIIDINGNPVGFMTLTIKES